jgi:ABC-2 type transport system ATP-binding protein
MSVKELVIRFRLSAEEFWALRGVSVEVPEGGALGLVGQNGSGKTTLLKIIAGILRPSEGRVVTRGRIAALLALGAGFHPELTGRENVYLNASLLGLSRQQIDRWFDDIVGFAELEDFIDSQVKFYSSGMYIRLGFAVAVHVDPAILLVDEVLAVGDLAFQRKCLDRVAELQRDGRTIVVVSHDPDLIERVCQSSIMLEHGEVKARGDPVVVMEEYRRAMSKKEILFVEEEGTREIEIVSLEIFGRGGAVLESFHAGDEMTVQMDLRANQPVDDAIVSMAIHDQNGAVAFGTSTALQGVPLPRFDGKERVEFLLKTLPFMWGRYFVSVAVHSGDSSRVYDRKEQRSSFSITRGAGPGIVWIPVECRVEPL